jgi:hypothetical protein
MAASQRQWAAPDVSTWKPSQGGSSQNHNARNAAPAVSEAIVVSQGMPRSGFSPIPACLLAIGSFPNAEVLTDNQRDVKTRSRGSE